jgi:hypothetical protein
MIITLDTKKVPEGHVQAVRLRDGLRVRYDKLYFADKFILDRSINVQKVLLEYDFVIENVTTSEVFIRFDEKGR